MTTPHPPTSTVFEPEFVVQLAQMFEERIRFNRLLGLRIASLEADTASGRIEMRP